MTNLSTIPRGSASLSKTFSYLFHSGCIIYFCFPFGFKWLSLYFFTHHFLWDEWKHFHSLEFNCHIHSAVSPLSLFVAQQDELEVYSQFVFLSGREGNLRLPLSERAQQRNSFHFKCLFKTTPLAEVSQQSLESSYLALDSLLRKHLLIPANNTPNFPLRLPAPS